MNVLFFDKNTKRTSEAFEFFNKKEDVVFMAARSVYYLREISSAADSIILFDADLTEELIEQLIGFNRLYLVFDNDNMENNMKGFRINARVVNSFTSFEQLYNILKKEENFRIKSTKQIDDAIDFLLEKCYLPDHLKGYAYIKQAIKNCYFNPEMLDGITKNLYPVLAKYFNTSAEGIERSIRTAINNGWDKGNPYYNKIFSFKTENRPTNLIYIEKMTKYVHEICDTRVNN